MIVRELVEVEGRAGGYDPAVPELVVMVGLQGSGKTAWVQSHLAGTHTVVSKDHWPNARRREARQRRVVAAELAAGSDVVVDNTNPAPEDRAPLVAIARAAGVPVRAVYVDTPLEVCLTRNAARPAPVPEVGVRATHRRLVPPDPAEGFTRVDRVPPAPREPGNRAAEPVRDPVAGR